MKLRCVTRFQGCAWRAAIVALAVGLAVGLAGPGPALADEHHGGHGGGHDRGHDHDHDHDHDRHFHRGPSVGLFFGAPALVEPPPVYAAPAYPYAYGAYPYAPVPITGVYMSPYGYYCRDYRTAAGIETACLQPDGVWRFIN